MQTTLYTGNFYSLKDDRQTMDATTQPQKVITWQTNTNGKMACPKFIHIDLAPSDMISEKDIFNKVFLIRTRDNSYPPIKVQIVDLLRIPFGKLPASFMWASHGMMDTTFTNYFFSLYQPDFSFNKLMAVYYYLQLFT